MISLVNAAFVPVWVNVREQPVPEIAGLDGQAMEGIPLNSSRRVEEGFHTGFLLKSLVLAPDGHTLLNPQRAKAKLSDLRDQGYFPYAQVKADDYIVMLNGALRRLEQQRTGQTAAGGFQSGR